MHRVDSFGATLDEKFTEGDPINSIPATVVSADWLNAIQEEIANTIEDAGLTLSKPNNNQLTAAIAAIAGIAAGWTTGDVKLTMKATADAGWVMCNDGTIGSAASGATTRAHADTEALYFLLWDNVSNTHAPVTGGRGASASDDFAANKPIALTKMLGRALGLAGSGAGLSARSLGATVGTESHTLDVAEMPLHGHPARRCNAAQSTASSQTSGGYMTNSGSNVNDAAHTGTPAATAGQQIGGTGGGQAHNNMQPTAFLNAMIKL